MPGRPAAAKKAADSAASEVPGAALEMVAGQVLAGRYAPRRRSLAALFGELPGMLVGAAVPALVAGAGLVWLQTTGPLGAVSGLVLWSAVAFAGWWLGFLSVERVVDRIEGRGFEGVWTRRSEALRRSLPGLMIFLAAYALLYALGAGLLLVSFGGPKQGVYIGLGMVVYVGAPGFLLAPWLAARGQVRARLGEEGPAWAAMQGILVSVMAPLSVIPNYLREVAVRRRAGLGWFHRVPSAGSLDLLTISSPLVHGAALGALATAFGPGFFRGLPLLVGLGALHVQHELAVLAETGAGVEARDRGELRELLGEAR